jgi:hypothetical protein
MHNAPDRRVITWGGMDRYRSAAALAALALSGCPIDDLTRGAPDGGAGGSRVDARIACASVTCAAPAEVCCYDRCNAIGSVCAPGGTDCNAVNSCQSTLECTSAAACPTPQICCGRVDGAGHFQFFSACETLGECTSVQGQPPNIPLCDPMAPSPCPSGTCLPISTAPDFHACL